jgi:hypothetical protein
MPLETIRYAIAGDAAALAALGAKTFRDTYAAFNTPENMAMHLASAFSPEQQRVEIEDPSGFILVAQAPELIAYAQVTREIAPPASAMHGRSRSNDSMLIAPGMVLASRNGS